MLCACVYFSVCKCPYLCAFRCTFTAHASLKSTLLYLTVILVHMNTPVHECNFAFSVGKCISQPTSRTLGICGMLRSHSYHCYHSQSAYTNKLTFHSHFAFVIFLLVSFCLFSFLFFLFFFSSLLFIIQKLFASSRKTLPILQRNLSIHVCVRVGLSARLRIFRHPQKGVFLV